MGLFEVLEFVKDTNLPNTYHQTREIAPGEAFEKRLYKALRNSEYWLNTLLIISFDEYGSIFDHIPPPCHASPPGIEGIPENKCDQHRTNTPAKLPEPYFKVDKGSVKIFSDLHSFVLALIVKLINDISHIDTKKKAEEISNNCETIQDIHEAILALTDKKNEVRER